MKKVLVLVMACAMLLTFAACGETAKPAEVTAAPAAEATAAPAASEAPVVAKSEGADAAVDPLSLNLGASVNEAHSGDAWYKDGDKSGSYFYLEKADNSKSGLACVLVTDGTTKTWLCKVTADGHLVDQDAEEGKSEIDLVFTDIFTAVNNADGTKYSRGTAESISRLFVGKKFVEKENNANTLIFNADGTGKEVYDGKEYDLKWELSSASTIKFTDSENDFNLTIGLDKNGALESLYDMNLRTYVPAA